MCGRPVGGPCLPPSPGAAPLRRTPGGDGANLAMAKRCPMWRNGPVAACWKCPPPCGPLGRRRWVRPAPYTPSLSASLEPVGRRPEPRVPRRRPCRLSSGARRSLGTPRCFLAGGRMGSGGGRTVGQFGLGGDPCGPVPPDVYRTGKSNAAGGGRPRMAAALGLAQARGCGSRRPRRCRWSSRNLAVGDRLAGESFAELDADHLPRCCCTRRAIWFITTTGWGWCSGWWPRSSGPCRWCTWSTGSSRPCRGDLRQLRGPSVRHGPASGRSARAAGRAAGRRRAAAGHDRTAGAGRRRSSRPHGTPFAKGSKHHDPHEPLDAAGHGGLRAVGRRRDVGGPRPDPTATDLCRGPRPRIPRRELKVLEGEDAQQAAGSFGTWQPSSTAVATRRP